MEKIRNLIAWQKAHHLVIEIYRLTKKFPKDERFILLPQILRAVISVPANLTEGLKRRTQKDQSHFLNIAEGSLEEVKYYIFLSQELGYLSEQESKDLLILSGEVGFLIAGLLRKRLN